MHGPVTVRVTPSFERAFRRLPRPIQRLANERDQLFQSNPYNPSLKTHKLKGELDGFLAYSVNFNYRVLFRFINDREILYYDIGRHDIYK